MKDTIYFFNSGNLSRKDGSILFESEMGKKYIPIEKIRELFIFGEMGFNKRFLELLTKHEIPMHLYNYYGYYSGTYYPREHQNSGHVTVQQVKHYIDEEKRLDLAKRIMVGSIENILKNLKYYERRDIDIGNTINQIEQNIIKVDEIKNISELMTLEGRTRELYYGTFDYILEKEEFQFEKRTKRPPKNPINAMISFGNSIMYNMVLSDIYKTNLDPRIGFLHATNFRRFTLNLDMAEIFKPIFVDKLIFSMINKKIISPSDFEKNLGGIYLGEEGKKKFLKNLDEKMKTVITHPKTGQKISQRRLIILELYKLQKHCLGDLEYTPYIQK